MDKLLIASGGKQHLLLGNEAVVRGALEAGVAFATCYPGTPSSEVPDTLYRLKKQFPGKVGYFFEYSTNEKVALECASGAAAAGVRTLCTMKHVGLNVAADPLMTLAYTGVNAGMVVMVADDPSLFSSQNEQDSRYYARLSGLPMLEPSGPAEAKEMMTAAFDLSEELGSPVLLRTSTRVNHAREAVTYGRLKKPKVTTEFAKEPMRFVTVPAVSRNLHLRLLGVYDRAQALSEQCKWNTITGRGKLGIITSGVCANYVQDAVAELGLKTGVKIFKLGQTWPLPEKKLTRFLKTLDKVLVVEDLEPLLEDATRVLAQKAGLKLAIVGKSGKHPEVSVDLAAPKSFTRAFEYNPRLVRGEIAKFCKVSHKPSRPLNLTNLPALPGRPPNLCAGCPHRATYYAIKEVLGDDAIYPSDIGCYTLGLLPPIKAGDFCICMGSSVSSAGGFAETTDKPVVAFIGDSTFFHSGITGLVNAVHNNHNFTLVIMDNGTTAMTGQQPHPGVDTEALGDSTTHVDLEQVVRGLGVQHVTVIKPYKVRSSIKAVKEALEFPGVSVIISQELCVLYAKRVAPRTRKPFKVNPDKCKGHLDCVKKVACPAMFIQEGKANINPLQCVGCALCAQICPEHAISAG
jgi:indolepyruvate ferredoxin oxidoreductase alpha subunit